jgi:hypothetical protein
MMTTDDRTPTSSPGRKGAERSVVPLDKIHIPITAWILISAAVAAQ